MVIAIFKLHDVVGARVAADVVFSVQEVDNELRGMDDSAHFDLDFFAEQEARPTVELQASPGLDGMQPEVS